MASGAGRTGAASAAAAETLSLYVRDQFGCTEVLEDVHLNQPLLEVALRLESPANRQALSQQQQQQQQGQQHAQGQQGQGQQSLHAHALPELDLLSPQGETLPLLHNPAACGLSDGDTILCYRYAEACRQYQQQQQQAEAALAAAQASLGACPTPTPSPALKQDKQPRPPQHVGLYLSDWLCGYQARMLLHHDLSVPFSVLLGAFCSMRGIKPDDASFMWLQFYRKVEPHDTGKDMDIEDGDCIFAYNKRLPQGQLWDAVFCGDAAAVQTALDAGATLSCGPSCMEVLMGGRYPLHAAAAGGFVDIIRLLVARGADVNQIDAASEPALWHAIEHGHTRAVEALLDLGATSADMAVMSAASTEIAGTQGADVKAVQLCAAARAAGGAGAGRGAYAALAHCASRASVKDASQSGATRTSLEAMRLLLDRGCSPHLVDQDGCTAYDYVLERGGPADMLALLLQYDQAFGAVQQQYQEQYVKLCQAMKRAQRYPQALGCPCRSCNSLVEVRASETDGSRAIRAGIGCVALPRAVQSGGPGVPELLALLHRHGALLNGQDGEGRTALHQAARYNRVAEARWLLAAEADVTGRRVQVDVADFEGLLPLHQAACSGSVDVARLLVDHQAPLNHHTIKYITQEVLEAQQAKRQEGGAGGKKAGAGTKKRSGTGTGSLPDISGLVTIGGNSALALAVRHGSTAVVEYLLQQGAAFDLKNAADSSAFHAALDRGAAAIANLLLLRRTPGTKGGGAVLALPAPGGSGGVGSPGSSPAPSLALTKTKVKASKEKEKEREREREREREKERELKADKRKGKAAAGGTDPAVGGDRDGGKAGANGDVSDGIKREAEAEPALATDAGSLFLRQMAEERERLRQKLGLSKPAVAAVAAVPTHSVPSLAQQLRASKPPVPAPAPTPVPAPAPARAQAPAQPPPPACAASASGTTEGPADAPATRSGVASDPPPAVSKAAAQSPGSAPAPLPGAPAPRAVGIGGVSSVGSGGSGNPEAAIPASKPPGAPASMVPGGPTTSSRLSPSDPPPQEAGAGDSAERLDGPVSQPQAASPGASTAAAAAAVPAPSAPAVAQQQQQQQPSPGANVEAAGAAHSSALPQAGTASRAAASTPAPAAAASVPVAQPPPPPSAAGSSSHATSSAPAPVAPAAGALSGSKPASAGPVPSPSPSSSAPSKDSDSSKESTSGAVPRGPASTAAPALPGSEKEPPLDDSLPATQSSAPGALPSNATPDAPGSTVSSQAADGGADAVACASLAPKGVQVLFRKMSPKQQEPAVVAAAATATAAATVGAGKGKSAAAAAGAAGAQQRGAAGAAGAGAKQQQAQQQVQQPVQQPAQQPAQQQPDAGAKVRGSGCATTAAARAAAAAAISGSGGGSSSGGAPPQPPVVAKGNTPSVSGSGTSPTPAPPSGGHSASDLQELASGAATTAKQGKRGKKARQTLSLDELQSLMSKDGGAGAGTPGAGAGAKVGDGASGRQGQQAERTAPSRASSKKGQLQQQQQQQQQLQQQQQQQAQHPAPGRQSGKQDRPTQSDFPALAPPQPVVPISVDHAVGARHPMHHLQYQQEQQLQQPLQHPQQHLQHLQHQHQTHQQQQQQQQQLLFGAGAPQPHASGHDLRKTDAYHGNPALQGFAGPALYGLGTDIVPPSAQGSAPGLQGHAPTPPQPSVFLGGQGKAAAAVAATSGVFPVSKSPALLGLMDRSGIGAPGGGLSGLGAGAGTTPGPGSGMGGAALLGPSSDHAELSRLEQSMLHLEDMVAAVVAEDDFGVGGNGAKSGGGGGAGQQAGGALRPSSHPSLLFAGAVSDQAGGSLEPAPGAGPLGGHASLVSGAGRTRPPSGPESWDAMSSLAGPAASLLGSGQGSLPQGHVGVMFSSPHASKHGSVGTADSGPATTWGEESVLSLGALSAGDSTATGAATSSSSGSWGMPASSQLHAPTPSHLRHAAPQAPQPPHQQVGLGALGALRLPDSSSTAAAASLLGSRHGSQSSFAVADVWGPVTEAPSPAASGAQVGGRAGHAPSPPPLGGSWSVSLVSHQPSHQPQGVAGGQLGPDVLSGGVGRHQGQGQALFPPHLQSTASWPLGLPSTSSHNHLQQLTQPTPQQQAQDTLPPTQQQQQQQQQAEGHATAAPPSASAESSGLCQLPELPATLFDHDVLDDHTALQQHQQHHSHGSSGASHQQHHQHQQQGEDFPRQRRWRQPPAHAHTHTGGVSLLGAASEPADMGAAAAKWSAGGYPGNGYHAYGMMGGHVPGWVAHTNSAGGQAMGAHQRGMGHHDGLMQGPAGAMAGAGMHHPHSHQHQHPHYAGDGGAHMAGHMQHWHAVGPGAGAHGGGQWGVMGPPTYGGHHGKLAVQTPDGGGTGGRAGGIGHEHRGVGPARGAGEEAVHGQGVGGQQHGGGPRSGARGQRHGYGARSGRNQTAAVSAGAGAGEFGKGGREGKGAGRSGADRKAV